MKEFLTTAEAAERLKVTTRRVTALIKSGKLVAEKMGRDYIIRASALKDKELRNRKVGRPRKASSVRG